MTKLDKMIRAVHDLSLALLTGGIAGIGVAIPVVFAKAPTREIAGQIGNTVFDRLAPLVFVLCVLLMLSHIASRRGEPEGWRRRLRFVLAAAMLFVSVAIAFWLTPRMSALWTGAAHAADGSGLAGEARRSFLVLHIVSNIAYLLNFLMGLVLISLGTPSRK